MDNIKKIFLHFGIYILVLVFVVPALVIFFAGYESRKSVGVGTASPPPTSYESTSSGPPVSVSPPTKEDIIINFCRLIDEGKISDAVNMMDVKDDAGKQAWGVMFNGFSSFDLAGIQPSKIDLSGNSFEVDLDVVLKNGKENLGWVNGINKRWINLIETEPGKYKIAGIATGP